MKLPSFVEGLLARAGYVASEKAQIPSVIGGGGSVDPFTLWATEKKISPAKAMEVYTGWVYAAIRAIAMDIGSIDFKLFKIGKDQDEELFDHELLDLLGAMNDYEIGLATKYLIAAHLEMVGNAYLFLEGVDKEGDKPVAIHILLPSKLKVIAHRDQFPPKILGYRYRLGQNTYEFQPWQVIQIKYPDPSDPFEGIGTVQSIAQWVDSDNYAMEFNRRFFLNGARIGGFLESESAYTPEQLTYLKESFEATFKGVENAHRILALPKGTKYAEGGKTQKDLDFANLMTMMRDRIIAGLRVPRTAIGITDDVNRANADATDYVFAKRTIKPIMKFITAYLNEFLVPRYGEDLFLGFDDPVPEDRAQSMTEMKAATGGAPIITPNEARADYFGKDPITGGDELPKQQSLADPNADPAADPVTPAGDKQVLKPAAKARIRRTKTRFAIHFNRRKVISETMARKGTEAVAKILEAVMTIKKKGASEFATMSDEEYDTVWKGFALRVDPYEKKLRKAIGEFNAQQKAEVIANLPEITKGFFLPEQKMKLRQADLFNFSKSLTAFVKIASPIFNELAAKEGKEAAALLGQDLDIMTPEVRNAIDQAVSLLSESYNHTTRTLLKDKLEEGLAEGLSQPELAERIAEIYDYSDEVRSLTVARTETFRIANLATEEAWKQSGIVKTKIWYTAADERVCPQCGPLHGTTVSIEENFFDKGATITGSDGSTITADYDDISAGALHPNCRCYIRPGEISLE